MRLIDADALKKVFENIHDNDCKTLTEMVFFDGVIAILDTQPTINEWIPCSERLPEDLNDKNIDCFLVTDGFLIWMAYYNSEIGWQFAECTNSRNKIDWTEIIAWQPLPQPYKGGVNNAKTKKE